MPSFRLCNQADISRVKLSVKSPCCNRRKIVFKIDTTNPEKIEKLYQEIHELLAKYGEAEK